MGEVDKPKKKGPIKRIRRFFSVKKKKVTDKENSSSNGGVTKGPFVWTPEDLCGEFDGIPIPDNMKGAVLLVEVGGVDHGWVLDFSGNNGDRNGEDTDLVVVSKYEIPNFQPNRQKAPKGPPKINHSHCKDGGDNDKIISLGPLPWVWYKDSKTFHKIESGKLSDMVAYVTGRIAVLGDDTKWNNIDPHWKEAHKRVQMKSRSNSVDEEHGQEDDDDDEEEEIDEEARILATFKPEVEPTDPRTRQFWMRHFGTDALLASYLFLLSSVFTVFLALSVVVIPGNSAVEGDTSLADRKLAHSISNMVASVFFVIASVYFIKLSYPETTMLMAYHAMTLDTSTMSFAQRYFTANEMLIALWLVTAAIAIPYLFVALYEIIFLYNIKWALQDILTIIVAVPLTGVMNVAAMPDAMQANNGQGSRIFFDGLWIRLLRLNQPHREEAKAFWMKHLGNDVLAGAWIFCVLGVLGGIAVTPLVILHPESAKNWYIFGSTIPFTFGSFLFVRASYPETMNSSFFFSEEEDQDEEKKLQSESSPLIS